MPKYVYTYLHMKFKIALYSITALLIAGIIVGSFCDLAISQALCSNSNDLTLHAISGFGLVIPYMFFGLIGGVLFRTTLENKEQKAWLKAILFFFGIAITGAGIYYSAHDNFSVNGLYHTEIEYTILSYAIGIVFNGTGFALGFIGSKGNNNKNTWIVLLVLLASLLLSQLAGVNGLKSLFHRPRFRSLGNGIEFFPWYKPNPAYKNFISDTITKEEFKSFPSGHSSISALMMFYALFIPLLLPRFFKKDIRFPLFFIGFAYFVFIATVRVLVGAHFLSDVCFGGLITILFTIIPYEVFKRQRLLEVD